MRGRTTGPASVQPQPRAACTSDSAAAQACPRPRTGSGGMISAAPPGRSTVTATPVFPRQPAYGAAASFAPASDVSRRMIFSFPRDAAASTAASTIPAAASSSSVRISPSAKLCAVKTIAPNRQASPRAPVSPKPGEKISAPSSSTPAISSMTARTGICRIDDQSPPSTVPAAITSGKTDRLLFCFRGFVL